MGKQHLLLVDGDAKSLRVMEVSLKKAGFAVTTAIHGRDALEKVGISAPDLVLADTKMPEMDGFELCKGLKADERFKAIPFVFLTNQKSVEFKVKGLELGAEDYLTKPIYIKEIVTRVSMILQKAEKERIDRRENKGGFSGNLTDMGLVDLVQTFEMGRKTGVLNLQSGRLTGTLYFREGKVVDAELGRHAAENAFYRMLNLSEGTFDLQFVPVERADRIESTTQGLLMEGMRRLDELSRMLEQIPPLETVFELDYEQLAERLSEIPDEVNSLLRLFDGVRSLQQLVDDSEFEELAALGIISKLYFEGLIREATPHVPAPEAARVQEWLADPAPLPSPSVMEPVHEQLAQAEPELPRIDLSPVAISPAPIVTPISIPALPALPALPGPPGLPSVPPVKLASPRAAEVVIFTPKETRPGPYAELAEQWSGTASLPSPHGRLLDEAKEHLLREWGRVEGDAAEGPSLWGGALAWSPAVFSTSVPHESAPAVAPSPVPTFDLPREISPEPRTPPRGPIFGGAAVEPPLPPPPPPELDMEERTPAVRPENAEVLLASLPSVSDVPPSSIRITREEPLTSRLMAVRRRRRAAALWGGLAGAFLVGTAGFVMAQHSRLPGLPPEVALLQDSPDVEAPQDSSDTLLPEPAGPPPPPIANPRTATLHPVVARPPTAPEPRVVTAPEPRVIAAPEPRVVAVPEPPPVPTPRPKSVPPRPVEVPSQPVLVRSGSAEPVIPVPEPVVAPVATPDAVRLHREVRTAALGQLPAREDPAPPRAPEPVPSVEVTPAVAVTPAPDAVAARVPAPGRPPVDPEAQFSRLLIQAKRANGSENFRVASVQYRRALALRPDSVEAKAGLGIALVNSASSESGYREAVRLLEEAVRDEARDARAWLALGMAYQFTAQKPKARDAYQRYLTLEPSGTASGEVRALLKELGE